MDLNIANCINIINKFNVSQERIPYTYHHDYIRTHVENFKNESRSYIANYHRETKTEVYIVALTYVVETDTSNTVLSLSKDEQEFVKKCIEKTKVIVNSYENKTNRIQLSSDISKYVDKNLNIKIPETIMDTIHKDNSGIIAKTILDSVVNCIVPATELYERFSNHYTLYNEEEKDLFLNIKDLQEKYSEVEIADLIKNRNEKEKINILQNICSEFTINNKQFLKALYGKLQ
jgi:hypothetical protein